MFKVINIEDVIVDKDSKNQFGGRFSSQALKMLAEDIKQNGQFRLLLSMENIFL